MRRAGKGEGEEDPRGDIPLQRKELLVNWLTNKNMVSPEMFMSDCLRVHALSCQVGRGGQGL